MTVSDYEKHFIGRWAKCMRGRVGQITAVRVLRTGRPLFIGKTADGSPWQSLRPRFVEAP